MAKIPPARPKSHTNRSSTRPPRRGGLVIAPPPEIYATIPAVHPQEWMRVLTWALTLPSVERRRRRMKISSPTTIRAVASSLAASADYRTGRNVAVSCATIGRELHLQEATVKRVTKFLRRLGFLINLTRGANRLTLTQIEEAARQGAPQQRTVAPTRALILPGTVPHHVDSAPLPVPTHVLHESHVQKNSPSDALTRAAGAGAPRRKLRRRGAPPLADRAPLPLEDQQLAAAFAMPGRMPWLARDCHIGTLARGFHRMGLAARGWTVGQLLHRIELHHAAAGRTSPGLHGVKSPVGLLLWQIQQAVRPGELSPAVLARDEARVAASRQAAQREAEAARRAEIEQQRAEIDAIIQSMRLQ